MKAAEKEIVSEIIKYTGKQFELSPYIYERYDASNETHLLEIKDRGKNITFDDLFIEFDKFAYNRTFSLLHNKKFWYANRVNNEIYIWDIGELIKANYHFNWGWALLPSNTDWGGGLIDKYVGVVWKKDAIASFECKSLKPIKSVEVVK